MMARPEDAAAGVVLYPKPIELAQVPHDRSAVIEASAGTGKTYLLEHLVLDRLITGDIRIENILVVTFTDKGAAELTRRLRAAIDRLLAAASGEPGQKPAGAPIDMAHCWRLDVAAQQRLLRARQSFDRATIATMHGFCQGVLTEFPFASQRLFSQRHVDSRQIFAQVFREVLRRRLSTDGKLSPYLAAWLDAGQLVSGLEQLLFDARRFTATSSWAVTFDPVRIASVVADFLGVVEGGDAILAVKGRFKGPQIKAAVSRLETVAGIARRFATSGDLPALLREFDDTMKTTGDLFAYLETNLGAGPWPPLVEQTRAAFLAVADAVVPLAAAVAQLFTPVVDEALRRHKRQTGVFDFEDMLTLVAESLDGPHGDDLLRALRERYRCALIDEFQDTDPVQWHIFRRIFLDSGAANPLVIVGDPKQAIYGFRGADVHTYLDARQAVAGNAGPAVHLTRNFRSVPAVVDAYNAILDQQTLAPFFDADGDIHYDHPVVANADRAPGPVAPAVTLLSVVSPDQAEMRARDVRRTLTERIATEILALTSGEAPVRASEIFVLTRTVAEGDALGAALREAGIPVGFFKQDGLYQTIEAEHVVDLLAAIDDPTDRSKRMRAWLTPFFALTLQDLPDCALVPADHPLMARLTDWKELADDHRFEALFHRILDESGVIRRELFAGAGARRLTNYLHLFDVLLAQTTRGRRGLRDLTLLMGGYIDKARKPDPDDGNVQRREADGEAVQIMTMHKAKGLEAEVVFLYGGFSGWGGGSARVRVYTRDGKRVAHVGRPRRTGIDKGLRAEQAQEDQRLLYVALTRARSRLYLPYFGTLPPAENLPLEQTGPDEEVWKRLVGGYRHVNRRLVALVQDPVFKDERRALFQAVRLPCPPETDAAAVAATRATVERAVKNWQPPVALLTDDSVARARDLQTLRRRHAGFSITSYTRIKQAHGGYQAPQDPLEDSLSTTPAATDNDGVVAEREVSPGGDSGRLPGGAQTGIFLHAVLEAVPLDSLKGQPTLQSWAALPAIRALFTRQMRRFDRSEQHRADAERLVHAALTTPLSLSPTRTLEGVGRAEKILREVEFVYPTPPGSTTSTTTTDAGAPAGFVKGFIDFVIEDDGRSYLGDWKSDHLPTWEASAVAAHVGANYQLQAQLYAIALVKMLGITSADDYQARFGGMLFVFLRGLPDAIHVLRPSYEQILRWRDQLGDTVATGVSDQEPPW